MKKLLTLILLINTVFILTGETIYNLIDVYENSDLDYKFIKNIDSIEVPYPKGSNFMIGDFPVKKGHYTIYKFLSIQEAFFSYETDYPLSHEMLIVKTDKSDNVIDAYHYTLEWNDSPSYNLFFGTKKGIKLQRFMPLDTFEFENKYGDERSFEGIIDDYYKNKQIFNSVYPKNRNIMDLEIITDNLYANDNNIIYEEDSHIKKADYTNYIFDKADFNNFIDNYKEFKKIIFKVSIVDEKYENYNPAEEGIISQQPIDGFDIYNKHVKIIDVIHAE